MVQSTVEDRFWARVSKKRADECWPWSGCKNNRGYGQIRVKGKLALAHRFAYALVHPDLAVFGGMTRCVLHKCDNKLCVNVNHLFDGTPKQNTLDMIHKGRMRHASGEDNGQTKLTWKEVRYIRNKYSKRPRPLKMLCSKYGVSKNTVLNILNRVTWK